MRLWKSLSLFLICLGAFYMLGMGYFIGKLSGHSVWYLEKFFKDQSVNAQNYDALYQYAKDLTAARNGYAMKFHITSGVLIIVVGTGGYLLASRKSKLGPG